MDRMAGNASLASDGALCLALVDTLLKIGRLKPAARLLALARFFVAICTFNRRFSWRFEPFLSLSHSLKQIFSKMFFR